MNDHFTIIISNYCDSDDKATIGFMLANEAQKMGKKSVVFLVTAGIFCAVKGKAQLIDIGGPFPPLNVIIDEFIENGGRILVSALCMKLRGINNNQLIEEATSSNLKEVIGFFNERLAVAF